MDALKGNDRRGSTTPMKEDEMEKAMSAQQPQDVPNVCKVDRWGSCQTRHALRYDIWPATTCYRMPDFVLGTPGPCRAPEILNGETQSHAARLQLVQSPKQMDMPRAGH
jgi:hypothetical protein